MKQSDENWDLADFGPSETIPKEFSNPDNLSLSNQKKERFTQDTKFRKSFSEWVMWIVPLWLIGTFILMICAGLGWMTFSDAAIVALLTTTTANVLGLAHIVLKGLFPEGK